MVLNELSTVMARHQWRNFACFVFLLAMAMPLIAVSAPEPGQQSSGGSYRLFWNSIHGGGARSNGGSYTILSAIGQADAGRHNGGVYVVRGGFLPTKEVPPDVLFRDGFE